MSTGRLFTLSDWISKWIPQKKSDSLPVKPKTTIDNMRMAFNEVWLNRKQHLKYGDFDIEMDRHFRRTTQALSQPSPLKNHQPLKINRTLLDRTLLSNATIKKLDIVGQPLIHEMRRFNWVMSVLGVPTKLWISPSIFDCSYINDKKWDSERLALNINAGNYESRIFLTDNQVKDNRVWSVRKDLYIYFWLPDNQQKPYLLVRLAGDDLILFVGFKFRAKLTTPSVDDHHPLAGESQASNEFSNGGIIIWEGIGKHLFERYSNPMNRSDVENILGLSASALNKYPPFPEKPLE